MRARRAGWCGVVWLVIGHTHTHTHHRVAGGGGEASVVNAKEHRELPDARFGLCSAVVHLGSKHDASTAR